MRPFASSVATATCAVVSIEPQSKAAAASMLVGVMARLAAARGSSIRVVSYDHASVEPSATFGAPGLELGAGVAAPGGVDIARGARAVVAAHDEQEQRGAPHPVQRTAISGCAGAAAASP